MVPNMDAVGQVVGTRERSWDSRDGLLYAVGVGAGQDPVDPKELPYTTENSRGVVQRILPTFAAVIGAGPSSTAVLGEGIDTSKRLHGEQRIELHKPIPVAGTLVTTGTLAAVYDKGNAMVVVTESKSVLQETGETIISSVSTGFLRGAGGWGGDRGPSGAKNPPPDRAPDHVVTYTTRQDQALTYRLSGDRNPLHSDPEAAKSAGFPRPILHGLCTFGFTGRALLHALCDSDDTRFKVMEARFAHPTMPGDALTVKMWIVGDGEALYTTEDQDGDVKISDGRCVFTTS